jgi:NitT/TauT family transport system permease protein
MQSRSAAATIESQEEFVVVEMPLTAFEKLYAIGAIRKGFVVLMLALIWQGYATFLDNSLLFPTLSDTLLALFNGIVHGELLLRIWYSVRLLLIGYAIGLALATILTAFAMTSKLGADFMETLTAMLNPLPAIALLPLAMIWFGLGNTSVLFVLIHSVLWAAALNTLSGFQSVSSTLRMVGRNYELSLRNYIAKILIPAAFPSILSGLKISWAFAWRTLIAAELVFGASAQSGGLGWYIYENKNLLQIPEVFAGLLAVILIGLSVENLVFATMERQTVRKWGMQQ